MLIRITSSNPDFYSILQKNPSTFEGVQLRPIKNGTGIGFLNQGEYHLIFQDTKYSFADQESQIDFQSYCNPRVPLFLFAEFLRHCMVNKSEYFSKNLPWLGKNVSEVDVAGYRHSLWIENLYMDGYSVKQPFVLSSYFPEIQLIHKGGNLYSLKIETEESFYRLINLAALTCMFIAVTNEQPWFLTTDLIRKYIRIMNNLSPIPYFMLYLFAKRCIPERSIFEQIKDELVQAFDGELRLDWGSSQDMRLRAIWSRLCQLDGTEIEDEISYHIFEVGCGEMDYARHFFSHLSPERNWIATDLNDYSHLVNSIGKKNRKASLSFVPGGFENLPKDLSLGSAAMLMIEVIEHMPFEDAKEFIKTQISNVEARSQLDLVLITTPNKNFNQYLGDRPFRHDDHHFELTTNEFENLISELVPSTYEKKFFGIGDCIDGEYLTLGVELRKIQNVN